jgi:prolipoprotein diacylglyceryltransferase
VVFESVDALPRHPVQLYEAVGYLAISVVLLGVYRRRGRRTPYGLLFGWFMVLVFAVRIAAEFFKVPQAAYEAGQVFSVGQWLSLPFMVLGLGMVFYSRTHPVSNVP